MYVSEGQLPYFTQNNKDPNMLPEMLVMQVCFIAVNTGSIVMIKVQIDCLQLFITLLDTYECKIQSSVIVKLV